MTTYAITFGVKYNDRQIVHPVDKFITGQHFVTVDADEGGEYEARLRVVNAFGGDWAFIYPFDEDFERQIRWYKLEDYTDKLEDHVRAALDRHVEPPV